MPTYVYKCIKCSIIESINHGMDYEYDESCVCGGTMRKVFTPAGISFKGSGFYSNDSRGK